MLSIFYGNGMIDTTSINQIACNFYFGLVINQAIFYSSAAVTQAFLLVLMLTGFLDALWDHGPVEVLKKKCTANSFRACSN